MSSLNIWTWTSSKKVGGWDHRVMTPPPPPTNAEKAGRNHLSEENVHLLPAGIGERYSQTISNLCQVALLPRCELPGSPYKRKCWTYSVVPLGNSFLWGWDSVFQLLGHFLLENHANPHMHFSVYSRILFYLLKGSQMVWKNSYCAPEMILTHCL